MGGFALQPKTTAAQAHWKPQRSTPRGSSQRRVEEGACRGQVPRCVGAANEKIRCLMTHRSRLEMDECAGGTDVTGIGLARV